MSDREILEILLAKFEKIDERFEKLEKKLDSVIEDVSKIKGRLDVIELKQDMMQKKLDNLELDVKVSEREIRRDIRKLQDAQDTIIAVLQGNDISRIYVLTSFMPVPS